MTGRALPQGRTISTEALADAGACCAACAAEASCSGWSYALCANTYASKGDCLLKSLQHETYPVLDFSLEPEYHVKWISGVTAPRETLVDTHDCQPIGDACGTDWQGCPQLMELLECASDFSCGPLNLATTSSSDEDGSKLLTLNQNSYIASVFPCPCRTRQCVASGPATLYVSMAPGCLQSVSALSACQAMSA